MHMTVQREEWLVARDHVGDCRAANRSHLDSTHRYLGLEGRIQRWRLVDDSVVRWTVNIVDGFRLVVDLHRQCVELRLELVFKKLAWTMPGSDVRSAAG